MKIITRMILIILAVLQIANAAEKEEVAKLYVATFNRAADTLGLAYWDGSAAVHTDKTDLKDIAANIILSDEYQGLYGGMSRERTIIEMYLNLFNRVVDGNDDGIIYWATGDGSTIALDVMILALINGAEAPTGNPIDAAVLANKTAVGIAFANAGFSDPSNVMAKVAMSGVTADSDTVDFIKERITSDALVSSVWNSFGTISHNGITYGMISSLVTGKVWLDKNLGASQVCISSSDEACYGDYYQWGRDTDGHEKKKQYRVYDFRIR